MNIYLTIEINPKILENDSEQHTIGKDTMRRGKNICHVLNDEKV